MVNELLRTKPMHPQDLADVIARNPNHRGSKLLKPFIEEPTGVTASVLEDLFLELCRRHGLPTPRTNVVVNGKEADALFERERVIVELDSWQFHADKTAFRGDRRRDSKQLIAGFWTARYTHEDLTTDQQETADELRTILESRR